MVAAFYREILCVANFRAAVGFQGRFPNAKRDCVPCDTGTCLCRGDMTSVAPQRRAKCFIQNAFELCGTPFPLRLLDIIVPSGWSNIGAVNPFNIINLLARGNYSASFSMGIARSSQPNLE